LALSSEQARELQERGIQAARAGQKDQARKLLQQSLRLDPENDTTWLWMASVSRDKRERLLCLKRVLEINPENEMGIKAVQSLGVDPAQLVPPRRTNADSMAADDASAQDPGIPMPEADRLAEARAMAEQIAND
jgi:tetratricopeptide (TPR) repeat protein